MRDLAKVGLMVLFLSLGFAAPAIAGTLEDGLAAYDNFDFATALEKLAPLAEDGNAQAQLVLALMHHNGWGVAQDYAEAAKWYGLAAEQGNAQAQFELGSLFHDGQAVPQSDAQMAKWHLLAGGQGYGPALDTLGYMYTYAEGVPQDYVMAYMWYSLAVVREGDASAAESRDRLSGKMTPDQIAEAERLARDWKPK